MIVFCAVYVGLIAAFAFSMPAGNTGLVWWLWVICGVGALSATATELTLLAYWLGLRVTGALHRDPYVPRVLSEEDRHTLHAQSPAVAMLMPAHCEVTTPDDAEAFVGRVVDMLGRTPGYAHIFLLFDSPPAQHENEMDAVAQIKRSLRRAGRAGDVARVHVETYRDKPKKMRNKPGSIDMWLQRHGDDYRYMFVLDADSSILEEDSARPETCDALARLVLTLERHPKLAMVQSAIRVHTQRTLWGWFQRVGVRMASRYHGLIYKWLLEGTVPSYGHNVLFRVADFRRHVANTLEYLSHDFLDAADLETAGRKCIHTYAVVTGEEGESSLLGYLIRDLRWARGNAQWANYFLTKRGIPLGTRIYLAIGILCYVWPLVASLMLIASVFLLSTGLPLITATNPWAARLLLGSVLVSLILPKALASRTLGEFNGSMLIGVLMSPALMMLQGLWFLFGAFGTKWTIRGSRTAKLDYDHARGILRLFFPVSLLGLALWLVFHEAADAGGFGQLFIRTHLMLLFASPLFALLMSCTLPRRRAAGRPAAIGLLLTGLAASASLGADQALGGSFVEAVNRSEQTTCAELDNGNIPLLSPDGSTPIASFWIEARHPQYDFDVDCHLENFSDENGEWNENLLEEYEFGDRVERFTIFDDGRTVVIAVRYAKWWRPQGMTAVGERQTAQDVHFIAVSKRVAPGDYREVFVLYQDGNVRLKPFPRVDQPPRADDPAVCDNVFGTSVIVGPAPVSDRPFVEVSAVQYLPANDSLKIIYRCGESAVMRFDSVTREATRVEVQVDYATPQGVALATVRSMYVADDNADVERVAWMAADGKPQEEHITGFHRAFGGEFLFKRNTVSTKHNTSAPDVWIGGFASVPPRRPIALPALLASAAIAAAFLVRRVVRRRARGECIAGA